MQFKNFIFHETIEYRSNDQDKYSLHDQKIISQGHKNNSNDQKSSSKKQLKCKKSMFKLSKTIKFKF